MTQITVYSKPSCVQCNGTYRMLDSKLVDYDVIDLTESPTALEQVKALGYLEAPVVLVTQEDDLGVPQIVDSWSGLRPDKIDEWAAKVAA